MLKIVVIDGNAISRNLLSTILTNGGHDVIGDSNTSPAGLARMIKLQPQVICIDVGQGNDEGIDVLDTMRNALPKALVFMISAKFDQETVQNAAQRGVHGFIVKPFNALTVLKTIRNAVIRLATQARTKADN
jgi:two-component system chemotaxis response regulator CheY